MPSCASSSPWPSRQQANADPADNYGIRPLPNLETRFVAADTLLALGGLNRELVSPQTEDLQRQLNANRERHFHANTRALKLRYRNRDRELRQQLADSLAASGLDADHAERVAAWDPYDQNARADWFDPQYMFGVSDGFDVVIGNPPYVQLQANGGRLANYYKDAGYRTFARSGDIYQLFYERGCQILKPDRGLLAYITANVWLKSEYGKSTRLYFTNAHTPLKVVEMGKDVFENTIVDTNILLLREGIGIGQPPVVEAVDVDNLVGTEFPPRGLWGQIMPDGELPWSILDSTGRSVMAKVKGKGAPLGDWGININLGIKSGCNDAFKIDNDTRQRLVESDPKSAEIIKPLLDNRSIQAYWTQWDGFWLITTHNGYGDIPAININDYPAVKGHLDEFYPRLEKRQDKGKTPYNLRNCTYYRDFAKEKLLWTEISNRGRFTYCEREMYCNNSGFILTGGPVKYLCAVLNSALMAWFTKNIASTTGLGMTRWQGFLVERLPIPKISAAEQEPYIALVDEILAAKEANPQADTRPLEREIDRLVYQLYGLTEEENTAIERSLGVEKPEHSR